MPIRSRSESGDIRNKVGLLIGLPHSERAARQHNRNGKSAHRTPSGKRHLIHVFLLLTENRQRSWGRRRIFWEPLLIERRPNSVLESWVTTSTIGRDAQAGCR